MGTHMIAQSLESNNTIMKIVKDVNYFLHEKSCANKLKLSKNFKIKDPPESLNAISSDLVDENKLSDDNLKAIEMHSFLTFVANGGSWTPKDCEPINNIAII